MFEAVFGVYLSSSIKFFTILMNNNKYYFSEGFKRVKS